MNFKKRVNGSWVDAPHYIHKTDTDTLTTLPAVIYGDGTNATITLKGNIVQNGTPTPDNPIMPQGTGERTGNLFDISTVEKGRIDKGAVGYTSNTTDLSITGSKATFTTNVAYRGICSGFIEIPSGAESMSFLGTFQGGSGYGIGKKFVFYDAQKSWLNADVALLNTEDSGIVTIPNSAKFVRVAFWLAVAGTASISNIMLNTGATPLPYEPYGYKIPILCGSQTTNIYLGETQSTRAVKKLVLTGEENWERQSGQVADYFRISNMAALPSKVFCTHFQSPDTDINYASIVTGIKMQQSASYGVILACRPINVSTLAGFTDYLATQYAAGTPVTVWYVLATPETAVVNEPLMKIGDYADTLSNVSIPTIDGANSLSVDTQVQPSEVTANYHGWHPVSNVHEADSGQWD